MGLAKLWPDGDRRARHEVIQHYHEHARMDPQLLEEMKRLQQKAAETEARMLALVGHHLPEELLRT
jgi:hypothetical protein